jgi:phosphate uptake regulator
MKRKINLVGTGTLTISLPSSWIKRNNIKKGDEIELFENENEDLTISLNDRKEELKETSLDITGLSIFLKKLIASKYKAGYDKLNLHYSHPEELSIVQNLLQETCIGYEIVDISKNKIYIEMISKPDIEEFDKILKKLWDSLMLISNDLYSSIEKNDFNSIKNCILRHYVINKYSDFCRRMLNKYPHKFKNIGCLYYQIENIEQIADLYRSIADDISKDRLKLSIEIKRFIDESNEYYHDAKSLNYEYSNDKMKDFINKKKEFNHKYYPNDFKIKPSEIMIFVYLKSIIQRIYDFNSIIMTKQG